MRISIRSKLISVFLIISFAATGVTGYLGYRSGRSALKQSVQDRMTAVRNAKAFHVETYLNNLRMHASSYNRSLLTVRLFDEYKQAFAKLRDRRLSAEELAELRGYYKNTFLTELAKRSETQPKLDDVFPKSNAALYLQHRYMIHSQHGDREKAPALDESSDYAKVHANYHGITNNLKRLYGYENILFIDPKTSEIIYSVAPEINLGVSLNEPSYADSGLARTVRKIIAQNRSEVVEVVDFEPYLPTFGQPAAHIVSGLYDENELVGIFAYRFPIDRLYDIISGSGAWESDGLGKTGEVYLVGADGFMRNESRYLRQDPAAYVGMLESSAHNHESIERLKRFDTSILTIRIDTPAFRKIFSGVAGTGIDLDYLGREVVVSYAPLRVPGFDWGIVAKIPTKEAFAPVRAYKGEVIWTMGVISLLSLIVAAFSGQRIAKPLRQLRQATRAFTRGFHGVRVHVSSNDEVRDLARTFNEMACEIESRTSRFRDQAESNHRLLEYVMPTIVTPRFRHAAGIAESESFTPDVTIVFTEIEGYDRLFSTLEPSAAMTKIRRLTDAFHAVTIRMGIEELSISGTGYLVACGLNIPHFDHTRRALAFALEVEKVVQEFNRINGSSLFLRTAIHRGPVTSGNIGRHSFIHDLWFKTIDLTRRQNHSRSSGYIRISKAVYDRISDIEDYRFEAEEQIDNEQVWILESLTSSSVAN